jgi:hypothetical protein
MYVLAGRILLKTSWELGKEGDCGLTDDKIPTKNSVMVVGIRAEI